MALNQTVYKIMLWECFSGWNNLLNFTCLTLKFHNCQHTNNWLHILVFMCIKIIHNLRNVFVWWEKNNHNNGPAKGKYSKHPLLWIIKIPQAQMHAINLHFSEDKLTKTKLILFFKIGRYVSALQIKLCPMKTAPLLRYVYYWNEGILSGDQIS